MTSRLLIADSDRLLCEIYERYFAARGFDVATASDGLACLERIREFRPDALLLEWEIPWGGGDGVLAQLRCEYFENDLRVVVTSDQGRDGILGFDADPVVARLRKPFRLSSALAAFCSEHREACRE
jgi:DNA-binding response OmpR family regulator